MTSRLFKVEGFTAPQFTLAEKPDAGYDAIVVVSENCSSFANIDAELGEHLKKHSEINNGFESEVSVLRLDKAPHRVIYSPTGPLNRDYDDVRRVFEAAHKGIQKALQSGSKKPHLTVNVSDDHFGKLTSLVAVLGALNPFYVPLLTRERIPDRKQKAELLGLKFKSLPISADELLDLASKLDAARWVMRDIGGSDPERMTPANTLSYVENLFPAGSPVKLRVVSEQSEFEKQYPLFGAVNRCVADDPKHSGRIIFLDYTGEGEIEQSLYLVGKGVVYDTGGHDLKTDGHMAGMHRDKCGAATVAGIFKFLHDTKPKGIHVSGAMCMVRNEIGPKAYVADEIITARSGVRVLITNTDAEGRMAMGDVLCEMKERALQRKDKNPPQLFTIATLTGHAVIAFGEGYSAVMENGPAKKLHTGRKLQAAGEALVDSFEVSSLRREDYSAQRSPSEYGDVLQTAGNGPSSRCPRGHQCPGAFLVIASGLEEHGNHAEKSKQLPYCHLDIAGGTGDWLKTDPPNAAALNALLGTFVLPRLNEKLAVEH